MTRETKVGLMVALCFLLLVGGVLGYKLYFTGDPLLSLPDGQGQQAQNEGNGPDTPPAEPPAAKDDEKKPGAEPPKKPDELQLVKAEDKNVKPAPSGPPPTDEPAKPAEKPLVLDRPMAPPPAEPTKPAAPPPADEPMKPANEKPVNLPPLPPIEQPTKPSAPPPDEPMLSGPPMLDRPKPSGPPPADEPMKPTLTLDRPSPGGPPPADEPVRPTLTNDRPSRGGPPPAEPVKERPGSAPPPVDEPTKLMNDRPVNLPPLPPLDPPTKPAATPPDVIPMTPPLADEPMKPMLNLPPSPPPSAAEVKVIPMGPPPPADFAPRLTGPAGSSQPMKDVPPLVRSPHDVSPPPPPNTFERKYDAPALGKPEIKGPTTGTPVARQPDSKSGIPLTVRPQPGVTTRTDAGIPVVMQSPTWNTPDGKAPAQVESFDMEVYVLKAGDTYATVSQLRYRSDRYQTALAQFNRERDPRLANPQTGMAVFLPPAGYLERRFGVPGPGAAPATTTTPTPQPEATRIPPQVNREIQPTANRIEPISDTKAAANAEWAQSASLKRYKVRNNDTIWSIAKTTLGNGERWPDILKLNKDVLRDVNQLQVGMVLRLPEDARVDGSETGP